MITHSDDGPEFDPDDPLTLILRPTSDYLGPPAGQYEAIRRGASRRRLRRAAAGAGLSCAVVALIALPLHLATPGAPASPTAPLAPPPASSPSTAPTPSASPEPVPPRPAERPGIDSPGTSTDPGAPTLRVPSTSPAPPSLEPSPVRNGAGPARESGARP